MPRVLLGALVWAGLEGLRGGLPAPPVTTVDPETMGEAARRELGLARLPASLGEALDRLEQSDAAKAWMGEAFFEAYLAHKRFEAKLMAELSPAEQCRAYAAVY